MSLEVICLYPSNPTIHRGGKNVSDDLALAMTDEIVVRWGLKPATVLCFPIPAMNRGVGSMTFSSYPYNK